MTSSMLSNASAPDTCVLMSESVSATESVGFIVVTVTLATILDEGHKPRRSRSAVRDHEEIGEHARAREGDHRS